MQIFIGSPALSTFRQEKLLNQLQSVVPGITQLNAHFVHFVDSQQSLSEDESSVIEKLLRYGPHVADTPSEGRLFLVVPRAGTISPWSSKATDIAHNCSLQTVNRIERGIAYHVQCLGSLTDEQNRQIAACLHDRMIEMVLNELDEASCLFGHHEPVEGETINILDQGIDALSEANQRLGLAMSADEIEYLMAHFSSVKRNPVDAELMMFAQANSEHCRHKIFNADWLIDGEQQDRSLFNMIRNTYESHSVDVLSAYSDNSSVIASHTAKRFLPDGDSHQYKYHDEHIAILMKVETHNHPTAISPFPGAATGAGGEIRDEGATGRGSKPKVGLSGFSVSNLKIPGYAQPWESDYGKPERIVSALDIMLEGPIGSAAFNNEFGRPNITGYFRTFEEKVAGPMIDGKQGEEVRGYHKPIMLAGGYGNIREPDIEKLALPVGTPIVVLGGPAMLIGLGGGAASSMDSGASAEDLDFASVQRGNPEMERRCQEVIDGCWSQIGNNPILSIHDVGAGGLSNALPELVYDGGRGAEFELREIHNDEPGMTPMQIWSNESQERYVLAISPERIVDFKKLCERERCPYAILGETTEAKTLKVHDRHFAEKGGTRYPVDMPLDVLLGKPPKMLRDVKRVEVKHAALDTNSIDITEAAFNVLRLPSVANKSFLITIGDRTVTGMVTRDQMVGPWQVPVADAAVTTSSFDGYCGEAMAIGERTPVALLDGPASARMAIAESLTNIMASSIAKLSDIKLSANWMAPAGHPGEDAILYDTVKTVGMEICPQLGLTIPVGKDSMSMKSVWEEQGEKKSVTAPLSLVITAFAPVTDVRKTLTPQLRTDVEDTGLLLIDLGFGKNRLGGSALAQTCKQIGDVPPDVDDAEQLKAFFNVFQQLNSQGKIIAWHDRSDGGLFACFSEMAFAGHCGLDIQLDSMLASDDSDTVSVLFNEEVGGVIQIRCDDIDDVEKAFTDAGLSDCLHELGKVQEEDQITIHNNGMPLFSASRESLQQAWSETSYHMQRLRDNPECAQQEFDAITHEDKGLNVNLSFNLNDDVAAPYIKTGVRPKIAVLREQGVNGQIEMAAAFDRAGFDAIDVHMSDVISGDIVFDDFKGLVACGGFSYGDVLGAGEGWAKSILFNSRARDVFESYFNRDDTFSLGVCNGCQMMANIKTLIPGAEQWPHFVRNDSEQFEGRFSMVEVMESPSILMQGMAGSYMPIAVAHGEGRAEYRSHEQRKQAQSLLRYVDHNAKATEVYPLNPNRSPEGLTGFCSDDGRATIMMPHPERVFRTVQHSWHPDEWQEDSPWMRMFRNARVWVG